MKALRSNNAVWVCRRGRRGLQPCHGTHLDSDDIRDGCGLHGEKWDRIPVPSACFDDIQGQLLANDGAADQVAAEKRVLALIASMAR